MKNLKGLSKKRENTHRHRQQYNDYQSERRMGEVEEGKVWVNGDGRRLDLDGEHTIQ